MSQPAEWLTAIGTILAAVVALFIALFGDHVRRWTFKPKLRALASNDSPHCVRSTHLSVGSNSVYRPHYSLRIAIVNYGNTEAKNVEVFVDDLRRQKGRGHFEPVTEFLGTYLTWSGLEDRALEVLNPRMPKYVDLGGVFSKNHLPSSFHEGTGSPTEDYLGDRTVLSLPPAPGSGHRQCFGPGFYRLTVRVGAANAEVIERVVRIDVTGRWPEADRDTGRVNEVLNFGIGSS